ncbi:sybindin [Theileria orientalis strain Shintoku]|uniref:Sybindin n=1 Tax=Theileria orientalis strain Shintoku TaxID=869250 RepID=J4DAG9_THEOR|nr:sybindin [Theileria orientalis strain Shintoku]PVC52521.1 sybindin [Theileria orientalis]BAM41980.1 sybindin [Theileria orientalis strain Shintoku]|eukprot:XP_009692281.1 sybindin [Theileria orientalis strain Shintoku]
MNWKNFGYACCLSCGFNFFLFQVLFFHLKFGQTSVELAPEKIPTASNACMTCGIINLIIVLLSMCYIRGIIKFNPLHYVMRIFNMAGRHGPATGANRYRRFTDSFNHSVPIPNSPSDQEKITAANSGFSHLNLSESGLSDKFHSGHNMGTTSRSVTPPPPPPPARQGSTTVNRSTVSIQSTEPNTQEKKPPFEMIDLN